MILEKFLVGSKEIVIRTLNKTDLKKVKWFIKFVNSIIAERDFILQKNPVTLKEERDWVKKELKDIKNKRAIVVVAECKNKIVGIADGHLRKGRMDHVAEIGIAVKKNYRSMGIGSKLMSKLIELIRKELKAKIIRLSVMETNKRAIKFYKKFGFKEVARIPGQFQRKGKFIDEIIMLKYL
jgi:ribosomal protein S18 acetylase RimI-like enzyme